MGIAENSACFHSISNSIIDKMSIKSNSVGGTHGERKWTKIFRQGYWICLILFEYLFSHGKNHMWTIRVWVF